MTHSLPFQELQPKEAVAEEVYPLMAAIESVRSKGVSRTIGPGHRVIAFGSFAFGFSSNYFASH